MIRRVRVEGVEDRDPLVGFHKDVYLLADFTSLANSIIKAYQVVFCFKILDQEFSVKADIRSMSRPYESPDHRIHISGSFLYDGKTYSFMMLFNNENKKGTAEIEKTS